ncbi:hypothetical protein SAMN04487910_4121 [Aquimarina amphilecti]|uniref:Uncharacterized protein n=1 Tax=Aquimarina amphilecti TaxID=1038014 RepID=A0A1H7VNI7_AQUAM|nr:hypothetical protein [Aquimarina amphilecti]SEM10806.1 hypothetical protein SAMN04487910_4121 [Aquimarina amphilecti]
MEKSYYGKSIKNTLPIVLFFLLINQSFTMSAQTKTKLPERLITEYTGILSTSGKRTKVNIQGTCIIKTKGYRTYAFYFSNGVPSISGIKFIKNDDTYTSTVIYNGKSLAITVDEEGDLVIGSTATNTIAFSGSSINEDNDIYDDTDILTGNNIHLNTGGSEITNSNGNLSLSTGNTGVSITNGNVSLETGNVSINTSSNGNSDVTSCILEHNHSYGMLLNCNSSEISNLPRKTIGIYKGKLEAFATQTRKGICTIIETGCKTYRLDFSNGIPSIHDIQFGRKNDFDEYTSVIVEGEYSSAIEIDMTFNDLEIDGEILRVSFDGKRN